MGPFAVSVSTGYGYEPQSCGKTPNFCVTKTLTTSADHERDTACVRDL
jgi:hypothetical protein